MDNVITSFLYELDLSSKELLCIQEYSEINQMKIYDNYLVINEFVNNDKSNIYVLDLNSSKTFKFSSFLKKRNLSRILLSIILIKII